MSYTEASASTYG